MASNTQDHMDSSGQWALEKVVFFKFAKLFNQTNLILKMAYLSISLDNCVIRGKALGLKGPLDFLS